MTDEAHRSPRLDRLKELEMDSRRSEVHRLAAATRHIIDHLVSNTASEAELRLAADQLEVVSDMLARYPHGSTYQGFREAANAGGAIGDQRDLAAAGAEARYAFFDHSPFIGLANPMSPPLELDYGVDSIVGRVSFGAAYEGPPGCVHGGYVAAIFDELLGATQSLSGQQGMTAFLHVDYRSPTPLGAPLDLVGRLDSSDGRKIRCSGTLHAEGRLCAEAHGLFISFDPERFRALLAARADRAG